MQIQAVHNKFYEGNLEPKLADYIQHTYGKGTTTDNLASSRIEMKQSSTSVTKNLMSLGRCYMLGFPDLES